MKKDYVIICLLSLLFFSLSTLFLQLPGVYGEETLLAIGASRWVRGEAFGFHSLWLGSFEFPLMITDRVGTLNTFLYLPAFSLLGANVFTMRLTSLSIGLLGILLFYVLTLRHFGRATAFMSGLLLSTLPFYSFLFRRGYLDDGLLPVILSGSLLCFSSFYNNKNQHSIHLGFFLLGLGLWNRLTFLWAILALGIIFIIYRPFKLSRKHMAFGVLFLLLGAFPFILYNLHPDFYGTNTVSRVHDATLQPSSHISNLDAFKNLTTRVIHIRNIFNNDFQKNFVPNPFFFPAFILSIFYFAYQMIKAKKKDRLMPALFIGLGLTVFFSSFTLTTFRHEHLTFIVPFLVLLIGKALSDLAEKTRLLAYGLLALLILFNLLSFASVYTLLLNTGTNENQFSDWHSPSDSVYRLVNYLQEYNLSPVILGSDIGTSIEFLSHGTIGFPICYLLSREALQGCLGGENQGYYLIRAQQSRMQWKNIKEAILKEGTVAVVKEVFMNRESTPEFILLKIEEEGRASDVEAYVQYRPV